MELQVVQQGEFSGAELLNQRARRPEGNLDMGTGHMPCEDGSLDPELFHQREENAFEWLMRNQRNAVGVQHNRGQRSTSNRGSQGGLPVVGPSVNTIDKY